MVTDPNTISSLFVSSKQYNRSADDSSLTNSIDIYDSYLQADDYDDDFEDYDDDDDEDPFESSQLHQLVHTQPVHLINKQALLSYEPVRELKSQSFYEVSAPLNSSVARATIATQSHDEDLTSAITSRSSSLSSTFSFPNDKYYANGQSYQDYYAGVEEDYDEPMTDDKYETLYSNYYGGKYISKLPRNEENLHFSVPRSLPYQERDVCLGLDLSSQCITLQQRELFHEDEMETNYHYTIQTSNTHKSDEVTKNCNTNHATDDEILFVKTVSSKLSRYAGYFIADSKDQEYSDKVRFQEISYKFSKTYF